jgi:homoserine kinase
MRARVRVPATCANLGPGFDCFGLALDLCNDVTVDTDGEPGVHWEGEGTDVLPSDGTDRTSATIGLVAGRFDLPLPSFALSAVNRIPPGRGLGSSSAAAVAGIALASVLLDLGLHTDRDSVFAIAAEVEGHPDNAAAAVYGGFTIAMPEGSVHRLDPHGDLRPVAIVPPATLPTPAARAALAPQVPREDAVYNLAHAALAVEAFARDPDLLGAALHDRLHQDARVALAAELIPELDDVIDVLRRARLPWCVSGAGPTLLAFEPAAGGSVTPELLGVGADWRIMRPGVRAHGFDIVEAA